MIHLRGLSKKVLSGTIAVLFSLNSILPAGFSAPSDTQSVFSPEAIVKSISPEAAHLESLVSGSASDKPFVVYIQDAHSNPDAQQSIRKILHTLYEQAGAEKLAVALEGSSGTIHPEYLRFFKDHPTADEAVRNNLLAKGELTGAELFASDLDVKGVWDESFVRGVEDTQIYRENAEAYRAVSDHAEEVTSLLSYFKEALAGLQTKTFNPTLQKFLKNKAWHKHGDYSSQVFGFQQSNTGMGQFSAYIQTLAASAESILKIKLAESVEQIRFPNLHRMLKIAEDEKRIDAAALKPEWQAFREKAAGFDQEVVQPLQAHLFPEQGNAAGAFKNLRILLEDLSVQHPDLFAVLKSSPALSAHAAVRTLYTEMDSADLYSEMETLETSIEERLAVTPEEKELLKRMGEFELMESTLLFQLAPEAWDRIQTIRAELTPEFLASRLIALGGVIATSEVTALSKYWGSALRFYDLADTRDGILFAASTSFAKERKAKMLVIFSGGFHSTGFLKGFTAGGYSYAVLRPIMHRVDPTLYHAAMNGKNSGFEGMEFESEQQGVLFKALAETGVPALAREGLNDEQAALALSEALKSNPVFSSAVQIETAQDGVVLFSFISSPAGLTAALGKQGVTSDAQVIYRAMEPRHPGFGRSSPRGRAYNRSLLVRGGRVVVRSEVRLNEENIVGTLLGRYKAKSLFKAKGSEAPFLASLTAKLAGSSLLPGDVDFVLVKNEVVTPYDTLYNPDNQRKVVQISLARFRAFVDVYTMLDFAHREKLLEVITQGLLNGALHVGHPPESRSLDFESKIGKKANSAAYRQLSMVLDIARAGNYTASVVTRKFLDRVNPVFVNFKMAFDENSSLTPAKALRIASKISDKFSTSDYRLSLITSLAGYAAVGRIYQVGANAIDDPQTRSAQKLIKDITPAGESASTAMLNAIKAQFYVRRALSELNTGTTNTKQLVTDVNTVLRHASQLTASQVGDQNSPGRVSAYLPIDDSEHTAVPVDVERVQEQIRAAGADVPPSAEALAPVTAENLPEGVAAGSRISAAFMREFYFDHLDKRAYGTINGAGKGSRFAEQEHGVSPDGPHAKDKAKGSYLQYYGSVLGWRSFYEMAVLRMEASNKNARKYGSKLTSRADNKPLVVTVSHFTEEDTLVDLQRLGFEAYKVSELRGLAKHDRPAALEILKRMGLEEYFLDPFDDTKISDKVTLFYNSEREYSPVIYMVPVDEEALTDEETGEDAKFTMPHLKLHPEDASWPDNHDGAVVSPILSGVTAYLNKTGRNIRLVGNIDNGAADNDPIIFSLLYLSGKSLLSVVAKIIKEKGGIATEYADAYQLPDFITELARVLGRPFPEGPHGNLTEGFEAAAATAQDAAEISKLVKRFNSGTLLANDLLVLRDLFHTDRLKQAFRDAGQSSDPGAKSLLVGMIFRILNYRYEQHGTVKGAVVTTTLNGGLAGTLGPTLFAQGPRGALPEPREALWDYSERSTIFEPMKDNIFNNLNNLTFALWLRKQLTNMGADVIESKLKGLKLEDILKASGFEADPKTVKFTADDLVQPATELLQKGMLKESMSGVTSLSGLVANLTGDFVASRFSIVANQDKTIDEIISELETAVKTNANSLHNTGRKLEKLGLDEIPLSFNPVTAKSEVRKNTEPTQELLAKTAASAEPAAEVSAAAQEVTELVGGVNADAAAARSQLRSSLTAAARIPGFSAAEEAALGTDFIDTFFNPARVVLYQETENFVLKENVADLPVIDRSMKLWVRYLSMHPDLTWQLDADRADAGAVDLFKAKLFEMAEAWGTPISKAQIDVLVSRRASFEPAMFDRPKAVEKRGFLSIVESYAGTAPMNDKVNFRRYHQATSLDRMIAAEALRNPIPDAVREFVGSLAELAASLHINYAIFTQKFEAYKSLAASA